MLPSAMMLEPPGQHFKLPDGPSVEPQYLSEHWLGNMKVDERISKFAIADFSRFSGAVKFHNLLQTASESPDKLHKYSWSLLAGIRCFTINNKNDAARPVTLYCCSMKFQAHPTSKPGRTS